LLFAFVNQERRDLIKLEFRKRLRSLILCSKEFIFDTNSLPKKLDPSTHRTIDSKVDFSLARLLSLYEFHLDGLLLIGANDGEELLGSAYDRFRKVVAVEPNTEVTIRLHTNLKKFQESMLLDVAAGASRYRTNMNVADNNGQSSSLLEPMEHLVEAPHVRFEKIVEVPVERLDSLIDYSKCPAFWIVDVQGFELDALKGAGQLLEKCEVLYVEVNRSQVYKGCTQVEELDAYLELFGIKRAATRWWGGWGDAIYLRAPIRRVL
jgi:FkbM family methyltransferase